MKHAKGSVMLKGRWPRLSGDMRSSKRSLPNYACDTANSFKSSNSSAHRSKPSRRERHEELIQYAIDGAVEQVRRAFELAGGKGAINHNVLWEKGGAQRGTGRESRRKKVW